jgi:hypothetical protein
MHLFSSSPFWEPFEQRDGGSEGRGERQQQADTEREQETEML